MPQIPTPLYERLRTARTRLHLTQAAVAEQTAIGASSLSEFEKGTRDPSLAQLQSLATLYQRSLSWMLGESAEHEAEPIVLWRQRPADEQAAEVGARFLRLSEQYRNLELWCDVRCECELPEWDANDTQQFHSYDAAALAKRVRDELALGDRPGEGLLRTLEEACGVKVFHLAFEPSGTAACTRSPSFGASILLNKNNVPWRRSFDIAHELFHLLTWTHFRSGATSEDPLASEREESLANTFASNLLMPEEVFRLAVQRRLGSAPTGDVEESYSVAREFGVSVDAVLVRMKQVLGMKDEAVESAKLQWRSWARVREERPRDDPQELPERYQALALTALRRGELSIGRFAEYVGISRQKALEIARAQEGHGEEVDPPASACCEHRARTAPPGALERGSRSLRGAPCAHGD